MAEFVAGELRLHGIRAEVSEPQLRHELAPTAVRSAIVLRGTARGDLMAWVRADQAHFTGPCDYPVEDVPVVDADLWEAAAHRPKILLVVSKSSRVIIVCSPRTSGGYWRRRSVTGERGFRPAFTCSCRQLQTFGWLKHALL